MHICASMIPGLAAQVKAYVPQALTSFDFLAPCIGRGALLRRWTRIPGGMRVNTNFLISHKEVLPVPPFWFTTAATGVVQLRGTRYDGHMCTWPFAHMCTDGLGLLTQDKAYAAQAGEGFDVRQPERVEEHC